MRRNALEQFVRRLLWRPPPAPTYPQTFERVFPSGRRLRFTIDSDPRTWPDVEPTFTAPTTVDPAHPDDDPAVETRRPTILPGVAISLAGWRVKHGYALPTDERLLEWFRQERDATDETC